MAGITGNPSRLPVCLHLAFCAWGNSAMAKVRPFPDERVASEYEWFGEHKVDYIDNADANMPLFERDIVLIDKLVDVNKRYGFPQKFRTSFAKNSNDKVWRMASKLHAAGMLKSVTLAMQSMDSEVLTSIKRKNIKFDHFGDLVRKYESAGMPTYTELIMGLPQESLSSYLEGIDVNLEAGQSSLFMYVNIMLPNTEQNTPEYRAKYGLKTVPLRAMLSHGTPMPGIPVEIQETVVETSTLPHADWKTAWVYSKLIEVFHVQGLLQTVAVYCRQEGVPYRTFYKSLLAWLTANEQTVAGREFSALKRLLDGALAGGSWDCVDERMGEISWPPEEFAYGRIVLSFADFWQEIQGFLDDWQVPTEIREQQRAEIPLPEDGKTVGWARECVWFQRKGYAAFKRKKATSDS